MNKQYLYENISFLNLSIKRQNHSLVQNGSIFRRQCKCDSKIENFPREYR